jgi:hypothetical protein
MKKRWRLLVGLILSTLLAFSACMAQAVAPTTNTASIGKRSSFDRKKVVEGRFQSIHPDPLPQLGGAMPGARLLERHRLLDARAQGRLNATRIPAPSSSESAPSGILPGIQLQPTLPGGAVPTSVVAGDFNQDGHLDFIMSNGLTSDLWIYLGKGDGTFQLPHVVPLTKGLAPLNIATASLRGNGILDLVVAEYDTSTVGVLLGKGDGTFDYEQEYLLPDPPQSVTINDFNHDGKLDIAAVMFTAVTPVGNQIPLVASLAGDGTGNFAAPVITYMQNYYSWAQTVDSGDVNGDGLPDLLITAPELLGTLDGGAQIYLSNGDGTFTAGDMVVPNEYFNLVSDAKLGDVNGDGCLDAVVSDYSMVSWVALGDCSGKFSKPTPFPMGDSPYAVQLADVNGDGHLDIVTSSVPTEEPNFLYTSGNTVNVALGDGKGNFSIGRTYVGAGAAFSLAVADFNGDGKPDVVTANEDQDSANLFLNDGTGSFGFPQGLYMGLSNTGELLTSSDGPSIVDLNGDGKPDVFLLSEGANSNIYATSLLNDGTGRLAVPLSSDSGSPGIPTNFVGDYRLGDFRKTGHLDVVAVGADTAFDPSSQLILFMPGNGDGTFGKGTLTATTGADGAMTIGDFNGDSKLDFVIVRGTNTRTLTPFLGNGDGTFRTGTSITFTDSNEEILRVYSGDFNKDGKLDVLVFASGNGYWTTGSAAWEFDGNGDGTFQPGNELFTHFEPFTLADINNDGLPDIVRYDPVWADGVSETVYPAKFWNYLGQTNGTFSQKSSYSPYNQSTNGVAPIDVEPYTQFGDPLISSLVGDYNADGKLEEVAFQDGGGFGNFAQILMGNGDGTFTPTYDIFPFYLFHYPLFAYDLDGSGFSDLIQVDANTANEIQVTKGGPAAALQIEMDQLLVTGNQGCAFVFPDVLSNSSTTVPLSSSVPGVKLPSSVTIPANATSAKFCFSLEANYDRLQVFDINATLNGSTATAYGFSTYTIGFSETLAPATAPPLYSGQSTPPITVSLAANPGYTSNANLSCVGLNPGNSCAFASDSLAVSPSAVASTTVVLTLGQGSIGYGNTASFTIAASDPNVTQRRTFVVNVAQLLIDSLNGTFTTAAPGSIGGEVYVSGIPPYALTCSGLPAGATCAFSGTQAAYPASSPLNWSVTVPSGIAAGNYPFEVNVSSGPETASTAGVLTVTATAAAPAFSPPAGSYTSAQSVTIQDSSPGTAIYYTTDGSTPSTASNQYFQPIQVATSQTIKAIASGINYTPSAVASAAYTITPGLTIGGTAVTVVPGAIANNTSTITVTPVGGFTGSVSLTATVTTGPNGAVYPPTFSFGSTSPVAISGISAATAVLVISTTAPSANSAYRDHPAPLWYEGAGATFACVLIFGLSGRRRRLWNLVRMLALIVVLANAVLACGGGGGGGGGANIPGTTPGSYTITVTGRSGSITATSTVNLTVQ